MSYSRTLLYGKSWLKLNKKKESLNFHTLADSVSFGSSSVIKKQLSKLQSEKTFVPQVTVCRFRYSSSRSKSLVFNGSIHSFQKNLNGKQIGSKGLHNQEIKITKSQADDLILRLTEEERKCLLSALHEYNSNQIKSEYEAEKVPLPTKQQLIKVVIFNAVPFVGFGFLDNFIMIVAGDYIDETLGSLVTISTMAAAALGNTISDVMGIGSAWYVEMAASKIGLKPPNLSPIQLDMKQARRASNLGRVCGIIVGCLLGMLPLVFMNKESTLKKEHIQ